MDFTNKTVKYGGYGFTGDQERGLDLLESWFKNPKELCFTLSGRAGTGKTYMIKYFLDKIVNQPVCVSAPTHKAVRNIEVHTGRRGKTLQSLHGLRPNVNLEDFDLNSVKFDQLGTPTMSNYKLIVIDECSMINHDLHEINMRRAQDLRVKILYVGDPMQLPPVSKDSAGLTLSPTFNVRNKFELKEIIRQDSDNPIIELLEIVVNDIVNNTSNFVTYLIQNPIQVNSKGEGYKVFNNNTEFIEKANNCFVSNDFSDDPDYARIASWKNDTVIGYNTLIRASTSSFFNGGTPTDELIDRNDLLIGYKTIMDEFNETTIVNSEDYVINGIIKRVTEGGFKAYSVKLTPRHGGKTVDVSIVDFRDKSFLIFYNELKRLYFNAKYANTDRSTKWKNYFRYKDSHLLTYTFPIKQGDDIKAYIPKDIDYAFSLTVHKLQGTTIKNTFVDLNDMLFYKKGTAVMDSGFAPKATEMRNKLIYTALSRTSKFCNIYLNI